MSVKLRTIFMILMASALFFGFLPHFLPEDFPFDFSRLHIFLFNLVSGGTIILYFTEQKKEPGKKVIAFLILSLGYAFLAFFKVYQPAVLTAFILSGIVESVRIKRFSIFPKNFFTGAPVSEKFHQASLLCLSIGLTISGLVILNNEFVHLIAIPKLKLNTFFLGFSFPLSLITMSVMFSLMKQEFREYEKILKNIGFWTVNLGVIIFFLFILAEWLAWQLVITTILSLAVIMIFHLFISMGMKVQQKNFLVSGMVFLLCTAVTGIIYIVLEYLPEFYTHERGEFLLRLHAFVSLYGWNLSGLAVICRYKDFPILLHSKRIIALQWITVLFLAPLGIYHIGLAACAVVAYSIFLYVMFSSEGKRNIRKTATV